MRVSARIGLEVSGTFPTPQAGVIARWVDANNHLRLYLNAQWPGSGSTWPMNFKLRKVVAGVETVIATSEPPTPFSHYMPITSFITLEVSVDAVGRAICRVFSASGLLMWSAIADDADLATGGTLASGKPGIFDAGDGITACERWYDDVLVSVPPVDAAMFASQSLEVRYDRVTREDSAGTLWPAVSSYVGDYIRVPPAGQEARTSRVIIKGSRTDPFDQADPSIDDISAKLFVTPRYLVVPS
jgi:hypothetical protein